jgi:hypothetical protein
MGGSTIVGRDQIGSIPFSPQLAGGAVATAIAPGMPGRTVAEIAAMALLDHQIEQRLVSCPPSAPMAQI